ncbi:MAG: response regulator [Elusimicrobiales bacterium]|jgi:DNA-binding response OmpR family regulator
MTDSPDRKILIVDTDAAHAAELAGFLGGKGYAVRCSFQVRDALAAIQNWKPDLVILNILLESFDPFDFLAEVKKNPFTENQKIIIFSKTPKVDIVTGPSPRVKGYLTKPLNFEDLKSALLDAAPRPDKDRPTTVLVADDDEEFSDLLKMFLESNNYRPVVVTNPLQVLDRIKAEKPAVLLLDIMMSKKDGFQIMSEMQDEAETSDVPIIVLSALRFNNFQERGLLTGLPEIVSKELPGDLLLSIIDREIGGRAGGTDEAPKAQKPKVLIADDQTELLILIKETLEAAGFEVFIASDGGEALRIIFETRPDIAVLDYNMPVKNGLLVAQELKDNPLFAHTPIIICTAVSEKKNKMKGLGMGIDDYLIKPVDTDELIARIRMILKRNKLVLDTNPLSKLPGNPSIQARVERELRQGSTFAVLYLDLNNFKAYNDIYGFEAGDRVIKATANLLVKLTIHNENSRDFIGHIGGDDFIIITDFGKAEELAGRIVAAFDEISPSFYSKEDRERGYIVSTDRQSNIKNFPFLSIAIGIVHNKLRPLLSFAQVSSIGSELKKGAKNQEKSAYLLDKRKD